MKKTKGLLISVLILIIVLSGCTNGNNNSNTNSSAVVSSITSSTLDTTNQKNLILIKDFAFDPAVLTIKAGETVVW